MSEWGKRWLLATCTVCLGSSGMALAQPHQEMPRLGIFWMADPASAAPYLAPFKQGLRELGWIEGKNIEIISSYDNGDPAQRAALAAELVASKINVFYATAALVPAARNASKSIPIVCPDFYDPVAEGFTTSMARPDGNITGISWQSVESATKRVQLIKELLPRARRIGMMYDANDPGAAMELRGVLTAASGAGIAVEEFGLLTPNDLKPALARLKSARLDALMVSASTLTWLSIGRITRVATANRIPVISEPEDFAKAGALIAYGADIFPLYRRSAWFVDKVLKGAEPKDLPIEQPTQFQLVLNLRTAKALKLPIPQLITDRATKIIR